MSKNSEIQFLDNCEIDKGQWDDCITSSPNSLIYARSFYLDHICAGWSALTGQNYDWVLPVTHKKKWGIGYLYQPPFTQQLGLFAKPGVIPPFDAIVKWLKKHFNFWEINWNYNTNTKHLTSNIQVTSSTNFVLDLRRTYEDIAVNYNHDLIKNIKRSRRFSLVYQSVYDFNKCIEVYKKYYQKRLSLKEEDYKNFSRLCAFAAEQNMVMGREVVGVEGELMAITLLLSDGKRLYNIMNTTTETGRKLEANHFLLDNVIKEFSRKDLLLDFEGSDLPGVKSFYENFGPINQAYFKIKYNELMWPLKLIKK